MYNVNIMKNGRKKKNSKSYSIYFYFMSGADLGFVWHEEWWSGEGGKDLLQERSWEMGFPMPRAKNKFMHET